MPPGRPRRSKNKVHTPAQPQSTQRAQAQTASQIRYYKPVKEEPISSLHDESDLISFRNEALARFIKNQELLENVTSKYIHSSKIIPPASTPAKLSYDSLDELKYDDIYFGDLKLLRKMSDKLDSELQVKDIDIKFSEEYTFQKESTEKLAQLTKALDAETNFKDLEAEYQRILNEYTEKFGKNHIAKSDGYTKVEYKVPEDVPVESAPPDYDPRSVNSMLNMKQDEVQHHEEVPLGTSGMNMPMQMMEGSHREDDGEFFDSRLLGFQPDGQKDVMDDIVDDDMGLINLDGNEDNMMNDNFDEDFLSQIDHSME